MGGLTALFPSPLRAAIRPLVPAACVPLAPPKARVDTAQLSCRTARRPSGAGHGHGRSRVSAALGVMGRSALFGGLTALAGAALGMQGLLIGAVGGGIAEAVANRHDDFFGGLAAGVFHGGLCAAVGLAAGPLSGPLVMGAVGGVAGLVTSPRIDEWGEKIPRPSPDGSGWYDYDDGVTTR